MGAQLTEKYRAVEDALLKAFNHFNETFAKGELVPPVIVVASDNSENKLGHFHANSWYTVEKGETEDQHIKHHEIKINASWVQKKGIEILETLLHEMAHQWNEMKGIEDCKGKRHNKKFKEAAEMFGLQVEPQGYRGWAYTSLTEKSQEAIDQLELDAEIFNIGFGVKKVSKPSRYISLLIDKTDDNEQMLEDLAARYGSKKEAVQYALERLLQEN